MKRHGIGLAFMKNGPILLRCLFRNLFKGPGEMTLIKKTDGKGNFTYGSVREDEFFAG
jgi:hypothetical protein